MSIESILKKRSSIRSFTKNQVPYEDVEKLLKISQEYSPSSIGAWQTSFLVIQDYDKLEKIASLCGNQQHIVDAGTLVIMLIDYNRVNKAIKLSGNEAVYDQKFDAVLTGSIDSAIFMTTTQLLIEEAGYGTTIIGAVRNQPEALIQLLNLPEKTFPVIGFTIGEKLSSEFVHKPRLDASAMIFKEEYNHEAVDKELPKYNEVLEQFMLTQGFNINYSGLLARYYCNDEKSLVEDALKKQGFLLK